jgi:hypothetical protein
MPSGSGEEETWRMLVTSFLPAAACTSHISQQMVKVQSTNHSLVLISAPNIFLMVVCVGV